MRPTVVCLFPGQGTQRVGMGRALAEAFPVARRTFEEADDLLGFALARLCFEGPAEVLARTEHAQPAIVTASVAVWRVLREAADLAPVAVAGHSVGEWSALVAAQSLDFATAVRGVRERGRLMQEALPVGVGGMAAVMGLDADAVGAICRAAAADEVVVPALRVVTSVEARVVRGADDVRDLLVAQLTAPVRWDATVAALRGFAPALALEPGPGQVLSGLWKRAHRDVRAISVGDPDDVRAAVEALQ